MAVLNKYSGVETQVGLTSLHDVADGYSAGLAESVNQNERDVLFPVHRLDKATTGCLVFGRTKDMARELSRQFKGRTIEKTYYAVVRGGSESFKESSGTMNRAIEVSPEGLATLAPLGRESPHGTSVTKWELVGSSAADAHGA
ncbi:hypothetical protein AAF712_013097 [Marasmius tenuissimus]|uniref:Pseudouridine synthase RsuA/RluA-like domain-containing protein n=1 Tax=Marasmius tenuissimus TaxID=585030 RepID=A0ABR2ZFU9_9AGAR